MTDILKEKLPSPQNLGRAACRLWGRGLPHNLASVKNKWHYKKTSKNNLDHDRHFKRETTFTSQSLLVRLCLNRNGFQIRADFGNSWNHPIWRPKRGENWQPKEPFYRQRSVILRHCRRILRLLWLLKSSWSGIVSNPFINVSSICLVLLAGYCTEENDTVQRDILN